MLGNSSVLAKWKLRFIVNQFVLDVVVKVSVEGR